MREVVAAGKVVNGRQEITVAERSARYMRQGMDMCFNAAAARRGSCPQCGCTWDSKHNRCTNTYCALGARGYQ